MQILMQAHACTRAGLSRKTLVDNSKARYRFITWYERHQFIEFDCMIMFEHIYKSKEPA